MTTTKPKTLTYAQLALLARAAAIAATREYFTAPELKSLKSAIKQAGKKEKTT